MLLKRLQSNRGCQDEALSSSHQYMFWIPSVCYSSLSWEGADGFQIKVKQVNFNLHSREHFAGGISWNQCGCFRTVTVYRQHPLQWVPDVSQGFYMLPPYKLVIIIRDINFTTGITNKDKELSLFIAWYFNFLSWAIFFDSLRLPQIMRTYEKNNFRNLTESVNLN